MGLSAMGTSLGGFVFPLAIANLIIGFGWESTLVILAGLALLLSVPLSWVLLQREPVTEFSGGVQATVEPTLDSRAILTSRAFWIPIAAFVPVNASFAGVQFHLGAYVDDLGFAQSFAATLISVTSFGMMIGKLAFGSLGDRFDHRWLFGLVAASLSTALLLYADSPSRLELIIAAVFHGLATGGVLPLLGLIYSSRFGIGSFSRVMGLVNLFVMGGSFGAIFSAWVFDRTGSYDGAFYALLAILLPAACSMYWLPASADEPTPVGAQSRL